jgi:hypothetical protein
MIIPAAIVSIFIIIVSYQNWRNAVKAALYIVVLEGILRKWFLPQASDLIYLLKDIVLFGAYLKYFYSLHIQNYDINKSIKFVLYFVFAWCCLQVFNPSSSSIIIGIFGLKAYFYYVPLIWILPSIFQSEEELYQFLRHYLILLIPVAILGIIQFFAPGSSPLNVYAGGQDPTASFSGFDAVRITGTFSYISGYSIYLSFCLCLLLPILTIKQLAKWRWLSLIETILLVGTSFMTGARSLIVFAVLFLSIYIAIIVVFSPNISKNIIKQMRTPLILIIILVPRYFSKGLDAFIGRTTSSSLLSDSRIWGPFSEPFQAIQYRGFDSYGIGTSHQGVSGLIKLFDLNITEVLPPWEGEIGRIILEIGPLGFLLWYGLRILLLFALWKTFLRLKNPFLKQLSLSAFLFHLINITGHLVFNHVFSIYYWFFAGFILLLPKLEAIKVYQTNAKLAENL